MRTLLFANLTTRQPTVDAGTSVATLPVLVAGQQWEVGLRFSEAVEGVYGVTQPAVHSIRASIGLRDARPVAGTFRLQVGTGESTSGNTTVPLAYNATAAQVAAALNALSAGNVYLVDYDAGSYLIRRADGAQVALTARQNVLRPVSAVRMNAYVVDGGWVHEARLVQAPYAFSDSAEQRQPEAPYIKNVVQGYTSPDGTWYVNEVQDLVLPQNFRGSYNLSLDYGGGIANTGLPRRTEVLSVQDGVEELKAALDAILTDIGGSKGEVTVSNPSSNVARIIFGGIALQGINVPNLEVTAFPPPGDEGDWNFSLDLNRAELWSALRGQESITADFEVEVDVYIDRTDLSQGWRTVKAWSVPVTLRRPLLYAGLATAQSIDWLRPLSPRSYVPFSADQIITGQQHWVGTIGFGTANVPAFGTAVSFGTAGGEQVFTIDHNLNTEAVHVTVRQNASPGAIVTPKRVEVDGPESVSIVFGSAVAPGEVYGVLITSAGPKSVFLAHEHAVSNVIGLTEIIAGLAQRIEVLERLLPSPGSITQDEDKPQEFYLPDVGEVLPDLQMLEADKTLASQLIASVGGSKAPEPPTGTDLSVILDSQAAANEAAQQDPDRLPANLLVRAVIPGIGSTAKRGKEAVTDASGSVIQPEVPETPATPALWPPSRRGKYPVLLQAVEAASVVNTTVLPAGTSTAVYRYTGTEEFFLPGDFGRKDQLVRPQQLFATSQGAFYRVRPEAGNIYYPVEFERELWRVHLGADQLPAGATLQVGGELRTRLIGDFFDAALRSGPLDLAAQYLLICELVELEDSGLLGAPRRTVVLGQTKISLSPVLEVMRWGLTIKNQAGQLSSSWSIYGKTATADGFQMPGVLRLRLGGFDVDDVRLDREPVRGQVALLMPETKLEVRL